MPNPSNLSNPRPWFTLAETAKKLSECGFGEGTEASVLRMALDSDLQLSVYFKEKAYAVTGHIIHVTEDEMCIGAATGAYPNQLKWRQIEGYEDLGDIYLESIYLGRDGFWLGGGDFISIEHNKVYPIDGLWDLIMIHDGRQAIEDKWFSLEGGINENKIASKGIYIRNPKGAICQLRKLFNHKECQTKFELIKKKLIEKLSNGEITNEEFEKEICLHEEYRGEHLKNVISPGYSEISELPKSSVLVVRVEAIGDFIENFNKPEYDKPHGNIERNSQKRKPLFEAVELVMKKWPEECKNKKGKVEATKIAKCIDNHSVFLFPETGELPLTLSQMTIHIRKWLKENR